MPAAKVNDLNMHYTERGDGDTVVALHAATVSSRELGWLVSAIVHESFNVLTPDLRGHGETGNPADNLHLTRLVDDVLEFIYVLGRSPVHLLGYSLGGAVSLYAAQRRPDLVRSLVMLGSNYRAPTQERIEALLGPEQDRPDIQQQVFDPETGVGVGWDKPAEAFKNITCPALLIVGDRDEFVEVEDNVALYRALPNSELLVVPHTDHLGLVRHEMVFRALGHFYGHAH